MNIAKYALDNPKIIYFFLAVLLFGGIASFSSLGKKEDAPFVIKSVVITTSYPGATPEEVEKLVTDPISREIQSLQGVYKITSESMYGLSKITFEVDPATPAKQIPQKWDELRRKVLNIQTTLPSGCSLPNVADDFGDVFGIYYALTAEKGFTPEEMRQWAEKIKTQIVTSEGVMKVNLYGVQQAVVNIFISIPKLATLGIDPQQLSKLLQSQNQIINTGNIQAGEMQMRILANGTYTLLDDLRNQLIPTGSGQQIPLGDLANIQWGYLSPPSTLMYVNGLPAIGIGVSTDPSKDVVKSGQMVREKLDEILPLMPIGMEVVTLYPEDKIAQEANQGFIINLIESLVIVIIIIMLIMGIRSGILIGSALLFCITGTLLIMSLTGVGLNRTSLAGFIIAMGMLVDNAIVVTDNARVAIARGTTRRKALIDGATTPQWGLLGATFIAIVSFLPLYLAPAAVAEIVKPLFIVLMISLGLSWLLALTQTTTFGSFILKENKNTTNKDPYDKPFYHKFEHLLTALIRQRTITLIAVVLLFIASLITMALMPSNFFPNLDKPYFRADLFFPDGYSITQVDSTLQRIQKQIMDRKEVKQVSITIGSSPLRYYLASTSIGPKPNVANLLVELHSKDESKAMEQWLDEMVMASYPEIIIRSSLFKLSPAVEGVIEIGFTGSNIDTLVLLSNRVERIVRSMPELRNVRNSWGNKIPVLNPIYSQERGLNLGISRQAMAQSIQMATTGMSMAEFRFGDLRAPILLKDVNIDSININNMRTLPVFNNKGIALPLEQIIREMDYTYQFGTIRQQDRQRTMMIQCDPVRGQNAKEAFNTLWGKVQQEIKVPVGYQLSFFGEQESQETSNAALGANMPLTFFLIFLTLLLLFKGYRKPLVILLMIPLILIGVVLGLLVLGKSFDFFSILGLLGLVGMNIKNAIVLVDQIQIENNNGLSPFKAVVTATTSRIIPVIMASGTTILGMLPLLFDAMFGGMAATIMGGLLVASMLTILVLPVTYCTIYKIKPEKL